MAMAPWSAPDFRGRGEMPGEVAEWYAETQAWGPASESGVTRKIMSLDQRDQPVRR